MFCSTIACVFHMLTMQVADIASFREQGNASGYISVASWLKFAHQKDFQGKSAMADIPDRGGFRQLMQRQQQQQQRQQQRQQPQQPQQQDEGVLGQRLGDSNLARLLLEQWCWGQHVPPTAPEVGWGWGCWWPGTTTAQAMCLSFKRCTPSKHATFCGHMKVHFWKWMVHFWCFFDKKCTNSAPWLCFLKINGAFLVQFWCFFGQNCTKSAPWPWVFCKNDHISLGVSDIKPYMFRGICGWFYVIFWFVLVHITWVFHVEAAGWHWHFWDPCQSHAQRHDEELG